MARKVQDFPLKTGNVVVGKENFEASKFSTISQVFQIEANLLNAPPSNCNSQPKSWFGGPGSHVSNMRKTLESNFLFAGEKKGGLSVLLSDRRFYCGLCRRHRRFIVT